jgi:hypothetical protein
VLVQTAASIVLAVTCGQSPLSLNPVWWPRPERGPDLARQVIEKARTEGVSQAARAVKDRHDDGVPLEYSAARIAVEVCKAVAGILLFGNIH